MYTCFMCMYTCSYKTVMQSGAMFLGRVCVCWACRFYCMLKEHVPIPTRIFLLKEKNVVSNMLHLGAVSL